MVFSFEAKTVRVEATEELLAFDEDANPLKRGAASLGGAGGGEALFTLLALRFLPVLVNLVSGKSDHLRLANEVAEALKLKQEEKQ